MAELVQSAGIPHPKFSQSLGKGAAWRTAVLVGLVLWLYAPVLYRLSRQWWTDPNFSHGFFVPAFSLYVIWQNREHLWKIRRAPSVWGLAVVLFSLCTLILGVFGAELFLSRISLIFLIAGMVIFLYGWQMFRRPFVSAGAA